MNNSSKMKIGVLQDKVGNADKKGGEEKGAPLAVKTTTETRGGLLIGVWSAGGNYETNELEEIDG